MNKKISIIVPFYNEEENVIPLVKKVRDVIPSSCAYEFILVSDGSGDKTNQYISQLAEEDKNIKGLFFYRNWGHQNALRAGFAHANGDAVITMDGDFQHPPEKIPEMIDHWFQGHDLVIGQKEEDSSPILFILCQKIGYFLIKFFGDKAILPGTGDFRLIDKKIVAYLNRCKERCYLPRGLSTLCSKNPIIIKYSVGKRIHGSSRYSIAKRYKLFRNSIISFTTLPLRVLPFIGFTVLFFTVVYLMYILYHRFVLNDVTVSGWTSLMIIMLFFFSLIFLFLGLLGEYISAIYDEVKNRPSYIIDEKINIPYEM